MGMKAVDKVGLDRVHLQTGHRKDKRSWSEEAS